jgi:putative endonuclease
MMMSANKNYWVYILASQIGGTLYIGVTNDLVRRVYEHKSKEVPGFTKKYGVARLVYFEQFTDIEHAIRREKRLKKWKREWKIRLIEAANRDWHDLYPAIAGSVATGSPVWAPHRARARRGPRPPGDDILRGRGWSQRLCVNQCSAGRLC